MIGKPLAGLHAPVPGFGERFLKRVVRIFDALGADAVLERRNWTVMAGDDCSLPTAPRSGRASRTSRRRPPALRSVRAGRAPDAAPAADDRRPRLHHPHLAPSPGGARRRPGAAVRLRARLARRRADFRAYKRLATYEPRRGLSSCETRIGGRAAREAWLSRVNALSSGTLRGEECRHATEFRPRCRRWPAACSSDGRRPRRLTPAGAAGRARRADLLLPVRPAKPRRARRARAPACPRRRRPPSPRLDTATGATG